MTLNTQNADARHSKTLKRVCLVLATAATFVGPPATAADIPVGSTFFDGFDNFDASLWGISNGWSNGTWHNCEWSKKALSVENGNLELSFKNIKTEKRDYICGEIQSHHVYGYGTFEARIRTQTGSGLNAAFFTYIGPFHNKPHDEIDFEILTRDTSKVYLNTYVSGQPKNGIAVDLPKTSDSDFITYSFTRDESGVTWYVDGKQMHTTATESPLPINPQKILASFWGSDEFPNWMGKFDPPQNDLVMLVDWIAFTELGEECQFEGSVLCALD